MRKNKLKILFITLFVMCISAMYSNLYAHSGRTDANGGHKDNKNASGLGYYHYHCGGYPAHLHTNGVCPYNTTYVPSTSVETTTSTTQNNKTNLQSTSSNDVNKVNAIEADSVKITERIVEMEVGESKILAVEIMPKDTENKILNWKSSNENIATISQSGIITAKNSGEVIISVSTANGKKDELKFNVLEDKKEIGIVRTIANENNVQNHKKTNTGNSDALVEILSLATLCGGSYFGYKKLRKK